MVACLLGLGDNAHPGSLTDHLGGTQIGPAKHGIASLAGLAAERVKESMSAQRASYLERWQMMSLGASMVVGFHDARIVGRQVRAHEVWCLTPLRSNGLT